MSAEVDGEALVRDRLDVTLALAAALFFVTAVVQLAFDPAPWVWVPSVVALVTALVFASGCVLVVRRRGQFLSARPQFWSIGVAVLVGVNPFAFMIATSTTYPAIGALLTIVAVGALMPSWRSAAVLIIVVNVCWVATAIVIPPEPGLLSMILQMGKADALAAMIVITWGRTRSRLAGANRLVRQLAVVDDLTGLPNRRGLLERGHGLVADARSTGSMVGVGFFDIDGLKRVNDVDGHVAGDAMIQRAATCLATAAADGLFAGRLGGDEFVVVAAGDVVGRWPSHLATLRTALADAGISASVGAAVGDGVESFDQLLARADQAMLADKRSQPPGRGPLGRPSTG